MSTILASRNKGGWSLGKRPIVVFRTIALMNGSARRRSFLCAQRAPTLVRIMSHALPSGCPRAFLVEQIASASFPRGACRCGATKGAPLLATRVHLREGSTSQRRMKPGDDGHNHYGVHLRLLSQITPTGIVKNILNSSINRPCITFATDVMRRTCGDRWTIRVPSGVSRTRTDRQGNVG